MILSVVQKPISTIPKWIVILFLSALILQLVWHQNLPNKMAKAEILPGSVESNTLKVVSMGEPEVLAKLLMLWLQAFDNQPGVSIPFKSLDYNKLETWLSHILELDPRANYPLLAASRIYTEVPDEKKQRQMMELVYQSFLKNPKQRWPWLAHVTVLAKHRLEDYPLALKYAQALADNKLSNDVPAWVRQLQIVVLEDVGELETVRMLIGGLIQSQVITDRKELFWLEQRLKNLEAAESKKSFGIR